jgi:hypothetical protein
LRAAYCNFTIFTVSEKDGSFDWADVKLCVVASIHSNLSRVIQEYDRAMIEILDHEVYSIDISRQFH